ncbi:MAG: membrane protein of unknown function [Promethearchaeota archaeon]|nr:MAG: membrane protein of unknown function [Candidatus Lokiarchaeota archaeon]
MVCAKDKRILSLLKENHFAKILLIALFLLYLFIIDFRSYLFSSIFLIVIISLFYKSELPFDKELINKSSMERNIKAQKEEKEKKSIRGSVTTFLWKLGIFSGGIYYVHGLFGPLIQQLNILFIDIFGNKSLGLFLLLSFGYSAISLTLSYGLVKIIKNKLKNSKYFIGI